MSALAAIGLGLLALGYAVWPVVQKRQIPMLDSDPHDGDPAAHADDEGDALRAWSVAAGELARAAPAHGGEPGSG